MFRGSVAFVKSIGQVVNECSNINNDEKVKDESAILALLNNLSGILGYALGGENG
jgi:hypothetical protein